MMVSGMVTYAPYWTGFLFRTSTLCRCDLLTTDGSAPIKGMHHFWTSRLNEMKRLESKTQEELLPDKRTIYFSTNFQKLINYSALITV